MNLLEMKSRMLGLDELVRTIYPNDSFDCVIVGGSALILLKIIPRGTLDVDVLEISKKVEDLFGAFDFNTRVKSLLFCFPYSYQNRLQKVRMDTKVIQYYIPAIEDLIVSKLYAYRKKDVEDIENIVKSGRYDSTLLAASIRDAKDSALNDTRYNEMVSLYKKHFIKEW